MTVEWTDTIVVEAKGTVEAFNIALRRDYMKTYTTYDIALSAGRSEREAFSFASYDRVRWRERGNVYETE